MITTASAMDHIVVDRGQPVIVTVTFEDGDPDEVCFSYHRPTQERPYVDDGFGQPASRIDRLDEGIYRYTIDTSDFAGGDGEWHFWGEWDERTVERPYEKSSIFGKYRVNDNAPQLL